MIKKKSTVPLLQMGERGQRLAVIPSRQRASQVAQWIKNPLAMQETKEMQVLSLGREDPLAKGMATHSSILV